MRKIPLILLTATGDAASVVEAMNAGADDCVHTTSDFALLKARVRAQIRRKQFEDEERAIREELLHKELETARAKAAQDVAEARAGMVGELESKNRELEAFAHSVSHDLRAPLRSIREFNQAFLEDFGDHLPPGGREYLDRVQAAALRMGKLIDSLLEMSRTSRAWLRREPVDLSALARSVASELAECRSCNGDKTVNWVVQAGLWVEADASLARVVLHNLLANAWKFTGKTVAASVEVGASEWDGRTVYFVRDNGAGFEQARAKRLFQPFERMHAATDFPGTGIGLATVRRIVERHGGEIWAESQPGKGATFYFTLASRRCGS